MRWSRYPGQDCSKRQAGDAAADESRWAEDDAVAGAPPLSLSSRRSHSDRPETLRTGFQRLRTHCAPWIDRQRAAQLDFIEI